MTSQQIQSLQAVAAAIEALALIGDPTVYQKKLPTDRLTTLPAIVVSLPPGEGEQMLGGLNAREDVGFPVMVTFLIAENANLEIDADADQHSLWREEVIRKFHNQRLAAPPENWTCQVEPRQIIDFDAFINRNTYAGSLVVRCVSRLARL